LVCNKYEEEDKEAHERRGGTRDQLPHSYTMGVICHAWTLAS